MKHVFVITYHRVPNIDNMGGWVESMSTREIPEGRYRGGAGAPAAPEPGLWLGGSICLSATRGATPLMYVYVCMIYVCM
jgi:hypothetical protein